MATAKVRTIAQATSDAIKNGYRSGLEERVADQLERAGLPAEYEQHALRYTKPAKEHRYIPDFVLPGNIVIETKGRFLTDDRQKHKLIKAQHPELDIRFVFSNSKQRISKTSSTTYAKWCEDNGFKYADKTVPKEWIEEIMEIMITQQEQEDQ